MQAAAAKVAYKEREVVMCENALRAAETFNRAAWSLSALVREGEAALDRWRFKGVFEFRSLVRWSACASWKLASLARALGRVRFLEARFARSCVGARVPCVLSHGKKSPPAGGARRARPPSPLVGCDQWHGLHPAARGGHVAVVPVRHGGCH